MNFAYRRIHFRMCPACGAYAPGRMEEHILSQHRTEPITDPTLLRLAVLRTLDPHTWEQVAARFAEVITRLPHDRDDPNMASHVADCEALLCELLD